jgi:DNA end-binding protein Ku
MRAIWSGHITFGLISIPVGLYAAIEASEHVSFRLLHRKDMAPIKYKKFCSEEDVEVPNDQIVKGYEVSKKKFAIVEEEELDEVQESVGEGTRCPSRSRTTWRPRRGARRRTRCCATL